MGLCGRLWTCADSLASGPGIRVRFRIHRPRRVHRSESGRLRSLSRSRDGRLLAPVMPYEWFHGMSDDDAFAVARSRNTPTEQVTETNETPPFGGVRIAMPPKPGAIQ